MGKKEITKDEYIKQAQELLKIAAESLQEYCEEVNGDMNDSLSQKIEKFLNDTQTV